MTDTMTQPFAVAFIQTCFEHGLTKEAAHELLQKEATDITIRNRGSSFAEGYKQAADKFPGHLSVVLTEDSFEKRAFIGRAGRGIKALWNGIRGGSSRGMGPRQEVAHAVGSGLAKPFLSAGEFATKNPKLAIGTVGGAYLANRAGNAISESRQKNFRDNMDQWADERGSQGGGRRVNGNPLDSFRDRWQDGNRSGMRRNPGGRVLDSARHAFQRYGPPRNMMFGGQQKQAMSALRALGKGVGKAFGSAKANPKAFAGATAGTAAAGGGLGLAVNNKLNQWGAEEDARGQGGPLPGSPARPTTGPVRWDPKVAEKAYKKTLADKYAPGIYQHNKEYFHKDFDRMGAMQEAIDNNDPGSDIAMRELAGLKEKKKYLEGRRKSYFGDLDKQKAEQEGILSDIQNRQKSYQDILDNGGPSEDGFAKNMWRKFTGRGTHPDIDYAGDIEKLRGRANRTSTALRMIEDQRTMLNRGSVAARTPPPTTRQMQDKFFPTVDDSPTEKKPSVWNKLFGKKEPVTAT